MFISALNVLRLFLAIVYEVIVIMILRRSNFCLLTQILFHFLIVLFLFELQLIAISFFEIILKSYYEIRLNFIFIKVGFFARIS